MSVSLSVYIFSSYLLTQYTNLFCYLCTLQGSLQRNTNGLPPKMPIYGELKQPQASTPNCDVKPSLTSCTIEPNGYESATANDSTSVLDNNDHSVASTINKLQALSQESNMNNSSSTSNNNGNHINGYELDLDTTVISDGSTILGNSYNLNYVDKCSSLERTVESLKNKLLAKEKDLTDLQLKQWSSDYLIDQLKATVNRLEKENAQLKSVVMKINHQNNR